MPGRRRTGRSRTDWRSRHAFSACATSRRSRRSSCAWPRPAALPGEPSGHRGRSDDWLDRRSPHRRRQRRGHDGRWDPARTDPGRDRHPSRRHDRWRAGRRGLGGPDRRGRAESRGRGRLEASGLPLSRFARLDAGGGVVTPGLIDPHTHLLFAGSREGELQLRQRGAGYLEILAAGGGILSTVAATRAASADELLAHGRRWLDEMLGHGVTTIEAKSGYGLDLRTELRLLEVAHQLGQEGPIDVLPTWLGAHAVPPEFRERRDPAEAYVRHLIDEQLPGIAAQGRARFADVFCERGVQRRPEPAGPARGRGLRDATAAARRRAGTVRGRGAGGRDRRPVGRPPRGAFGGRDRRPGRGRRIRSSGGRRGPAGHDLVPDEADRRTGPDVHRAWHPGRPGHRLQLRGRRRPRACRWR